MNRDVRLALMGLGVYLAAGLGTAAFSASLWSQGKPHFSGLGANTSAPAGVAQTVLLWPLALMQNLKGGT